MKWIDAHIRWLKRNNLNPHITDYTIPISLLIIVRALIRRFVCH